MGGRELHPQGRRGVRGVRAMEGRWDDSSIQFYSIKSTQQAYEEDITVIISQMEEQLSLKLNTMF